MANAIQHIKAINNTFNKLLDGLSAAQLNKIPDGFNNNIIWNYAHLGAVQQSLFYSLSGLPPTIDMNFIEEYKRGTKPEKIVSEVQISDIKNMFSKAIATFEKDYINGRFTQYKPFQTSFGIDLHNIDDAIQFSIIHDGLHLGYARALTKLV